MATPASDMMLLARRRFGPLFVTNLLGTFNDNLFKTGLLVLVSYGIFRGDPAKAALLASVATGLFILPFFLFSALAGQIADAFERARLVRLVKAAEVLIMALGLAGFALQSVGLLLAALFLMGVHSATFQPLKYAILPLHLGEREILGGTGVMEAGGFLAILGGQLLAGLIAPWQAGLVAVSLAALGLAASLAIPPAAPSAPHSPIDLNVPRVSWRLVGMARAVRPVWLAILAISWFYAVGAILLSELIPLVQGVLHARQSVAVLFLTLFSVGVAAGSLMVNRLLKGEISARYAPVAVLLLSGFLLDLSFAIAGFHGQARDIGVAGFATQPGAWRIILDLTMTAVCGGVFVIPLYAILQTRSPAPERSRILAAHNIVNAAITVAAIAVAAILLKLGLPIAGLIGVTGLASLGVTGAAFFILPETLFKTTVRAALKLLYRIEVVGTEHLPRPGEPAVVVVNHVSYLDGVLVGAVLLGRPTFALNTHIAKAWWIKPVLPLIDVFPVDATNPLSAKAMVKAVREGRTLVMFPEGRITVTGSLMKVFAGSGMVADKAGAPITAIRIDGAQYTPFSHMKGKLRIRLFPKIRITVMPPQRLDLAAAATPRKRRALAAQQLYDLMSDTMFATSNLDRTLFQALLDARAAHGRKAPIVEDIERKPLSYDRLVLASRLLARRLAAHSEPGEAMGLMLPNVNAAIVAFFALQAAGRIPAMLNYAAGAAQLEAACAAARLRTVITARAFVQKARLQDAVARLEAAGLRILWLEDLASGIGGWAKLGALAADRTGLVPRAPRDPERPAVILFTSGSEGTPKGVVLSHRNILANCAQVAARIDFNPTDKVMNALPIFHSFGLTGGTLLPMLNGVRTLLYPNPLHYAAVPALTYDASATVLFGSDTFLAGYARAAGAYDFYSLRYIFAGAEAVKPQTRAVYADKFGLRILEGYGATECAPVIAVNTPMHFKAGSVGRLLPGMQTRLDPVPGIEDGGRLHVRGPNVMLGYYLTDAPGVLQPPPGGWHDTGDVVGLDELGFATIRGRAKRFAKVGGEMISLAAVEALAAALWPQAAHAAVARPDPRKGEQLVLFTTQADATAAALQAFGRQRGASELMLPKDIRVLDAIPILGAGKPNHAALAEIAREAAGGRAPVAQAG